MKGFTHGGAQPVSGATIQLYAVGTNGDGSPATPLLTQTVLTGSDGEFSVSELFTCPTPTTLTYLTATGGNPGLGSGKRNPQISLMAALGNCGDLNASTNISMNEVTTVAAAAMLAPFSKSFHEIGSSGDDAALLRDAFVSAGQLVQVSTGSTPGMAAAGQVIPSQKLNTLASVLTTCVNTRGGVAGDATTCGQLFSLVTAPSNPAPVDTIGAMVWLAKNPTINVTAIYDLNSPTAPFQPSLYSAPADWMLNITSPTPTPTFSPQPGLFTAPVQVTLLDSSATAAIYFTTDGSTPNASSTRYTGPILIQDSSMVRAVAVEAGISSTMAAGSYTVASSPTLMFIASPASTSVASPLLPAPTVAILQTNGAVDLSAHATVTLTLNGPAGATLSGPTTVTAINGVATFPGLSINLPGTNYSLTANGPRAAMSAPFEITPPTLSLSPPLSVGAGSTATGSLTLSAAPLSPLVVTLASSLPGIVQVAPSVIVVPAGQTNVSFTYTGYAAGSATLTVSAPGYVSASATVSSQAVTLRQAGAQRGILMGSAVISDEFNLPSLLTTNAAYASTVANQYNMIEGENAMKWMVVGAQPGSYNFEPGDALVSFAQAHQMQVRGHTLCWNANNPSWLQGKTTTQLSAALHDYIFATEGHYKGKVFAWDVVNEAVSDSATGIGTTLKDSIWYNSPGIGVSGTGYIEQAFRWARAADPTAKLFYNDYGIEVAGNKTQALLNMLTDFKARGVPIDGVGLQMHVDTTSYYPATFPATLKAYTDLGLQVHITEMDVRIPVDANGVASATDLAAQAQVYQFVVATCLQNPGCTAIQTWEFSDKYSWIPSVFPGFGSALPFDGNLGAKSSFDAIINTLR